MVPVKIECECGQNYAFDVEPVNGRMPSAVSCPSCGADGTAAANDCIAQQLQLAQPAPAATATATAATATVSAPAGPIRLGIARPQAQSGAAAGPLALDDAGRAKVVQEARTKMMIGGDSTEQVAAFLKVKGFDPAEAMKLARGFYQERASIVRTNGVKKIIVGVLLLAVPIVLYFIFSARGRFPIRRMLWAYGVGIFGGYLFVSGIIMILAPKSERGAVVKE
ncbi:MAG TPA: hypothetical protein VMF08_07865 [Candidatus Sulfotelmatobacter sp.]|nr:hypothetical protein [Candidatus Sulfotelmatobacter sp.]